MAGGTLTPFDSARAKVCGQRGGIKSGIVKREKKTMRDMMIRFLEMTDEKEFQEAMLNLLKNNDNTTTKFFDQLMAIHSGDDMKTDGLKLLKELLKK